jgi:hypothetical protein
MAEELEFDVMAKHRCGFPLKCVLIAESARIIRSNVELQEPHRLIAKIAYANWRMEAYDPADDGYRRPLLYCPQCHMSIDHNAQETIQRDSLAQNQTANTQAAIEEAERLLEEEKRKGRGE